MGDRRSSMGSSSAEPPHSRLFIIGPKTLTEDDYRSAFSQFGTIEEIRIVKDRSTGENKGVTYIKYSKTSEAAKAMEQMNGRILANSTRSIKIMIAASREQGSKREMNEEEKTQRLFVMVPNRMMDSELYDYFKQFGKIDYANIIRDRNTKENKGYAYVKYFKFSDAAVAFEECDRKYKPVFAEPRKPNVSRNEDRDRYDRLDRMDRNIAPFSSFDSLVNRSSSFNPPLPTDMNYSNDGYTKLQVIASPNINQDQLWKLFDIVPGMDYCQLTYEGDPARPTRAVGEVVYTNPQWAAHAKEKLHGFEYPPGQRLIVKPELESRSGSQDKSKPDILQIAETIAQASSLIQAAGLSPDLLQAKLGLVAAAKESEIYCSVSLPEPQPLGSVDEETAARCFIVCTPQPLPNSVLKDVFCRFGNLLEVYLLSNRNCGYAKYSSRRSADNAIQTLHGAEVLGIRLKVLEAEERPDRKRQKIEEL